MKLKNLKTTPFEIAKTLASNKKIVNLLYNDSAFALEEADCLIDRQYLIENNYINFYPATETGINSIDKNTFLIINIEDINLHNTDNNISVTGSIYITTDKSHCMLAHNKLRLLELADEVEGSLENIKFESAGKMSVTSIHYVVFSDFRSGYKITFRFNDQFTRKVEL